jgi:hypothetical protein
MRHRYTICALALGSVFAVALLRAGYTSTPFTPAKMAAPAAEADPMPGLDAAFHTTVQPFVKAYCVSCHGGDSPKAGLDLNAYHSLDDVVKDLRRWNVLAAKLKSGEMPPEEADTHPSVADCQPIINWIHTVNDIETKRNLGDPGLVLARRLSNAEYDYTIRDLTGVDIQPTKEFPVDPANQAGFDNSGESLDMSPALLKKYLDAARLVADHIVFTPDGFGFSPLSMDSDENRDNYAVHRVVDFYRQQNLVDGDVFDFYRALKLDYTPYFQAAWRFQNRAALGRPQATMTDLAKEAKISPKYLNTIWTILNAKGETVGPIAAIQARWRSLPAPVNGQEPEAVATQAGYINYLITTLRPVVAQKIANLPSRPIAGGSQMIVLWKDEQYAANRLTYGGNALQLDMSAYAATDPALVTPTTDAARAQYEDSFKRFCAVFPDAFAVAERGRPFETPQNILSDLAGHRLLTAGFHSQMGYFRDDAPLYSLLLDGQQQRQLDLLWRDLEYVTQAPLRQYKQFLWFERGEPPSTLTAPEFNGFRPEDGDITTPERIKALGDIYLAKIQTGNPDPRVVTITKEYFVTMNNRIRALEQAQKAAEPSQLQTLLNFAERAYRRPLAEAEKTSILTFYHTLRATEEHEDAIRDSVVSILMSPYFCYLVDLPDGAKNASQRTEPLNDYQLASRLSYFLWSSMPDAELLKHAAAGDLHKPEVIVAQARRMLQDDRVMGLATEFAGNWLDIRRFEETNSVDRDHFPQFTNDLREAMFQEPLHFFTDLVRRNGSVLDFVYGDYTFVNPVLAKHYGMPEPQGTADTWTRVDNAQKYQRGGLLPMAVFLTKNAPGLRTSPVKRGNWFVTRLLGEVIPAPPPNVPVLPTDETKLGDLTLRQTLEKHRQDPTCASCHAKFDSFGLVFEGFGPIGEARTLDLAGRKVDTSAVFPDGSEGSGLEGLRAYLRSKTQNEFLDNLTRKLMVYALGRSLQTSDDAVVAAIHDQLVADGNHFDTIIEGIVTSPQFLNKRVAPTPKEQSP